MADFAPNYTARMRVTYTAGGVRHTMLHRIGPDPVGVDTLAGAGAVLTDFLAAMAPLLSNDFAVIDTQWCARDENFFRPVPLAAQVVGPGIGDLAGVTIDSGTVPNALRFRYRTEFGNAGYFDLFGSIIFASGSVNDDWRFQPGDDAVVDAAIAVLVGNPDNVLRGPEGAVALYNSTASFRVDAGWQRRLRA